MATTADKVVVQLEARVAEYTRDMEAAREKFAKFKAEVISGGKAAADETDKNAKRETASRRRNADEAEKSSKKEVEAEKRATTEKEKGAKKSEEAATRRRRASQDTAKSAREAADAEEAAQRRIARAVENGIARQNAALRRGSGRMNTSGAIVQPGERSTGILPVSAGIRADVDRQLAWARGERPDTGQVRQEREVNYLLRDRQRLEGLLVGAKGRQKVALEDQILQLRLIDRFQKAGLSGQQAAIAAERQLAAVQAQRAANQRRLAVTNTVGMVGGGRLLGGLGAAAGVGIGTRVVQNAVEYGKELKAVSEQLGMTTTDLQVYQSMASNVGVTNDQLRSSFGQFANVLGQAQQGSREYGKVFKALGIDIKNFASAGEALPTVIDRISQIEDPAQRAAIETRLFGEAGRQLDAMLSGGTAAVSELTRSLQEAGHILSEDEIKELDKTAKDFARLRSEMQVDFSRTVANNGEAIRGMASDLGALASATATVVGWLARLRSEMQTPGLIDLRDSLPSWATTELLPSRAAPPSRGDTRLERNQQIEARARELAQGRYMGQAVDPQTARILLQRERENLAKVNAGTAPDERVQPGTINPTLLGNLRAPRQPRGPSPAAQMRREQRHEIASLREAHAFEQSAARAQSAYLGILSDLADTEAERHHLARERLELDHQTTIAAIQFDAQMRRLETENAVKLGELSSARAEIEGRLADERARQLIDAEQQTHDGRLAALDVNERRRLANEQTETTSAILANERDVLTAQRDLADTSADRLRLERRLLDLSFDEERARLRGIMAVNAATTEIHQRARERMEIIDQIQPMAQEALGRQYEGPGQRYMRSLRTEAAELNTAIEEVAVSGVQSLNQALAESASRFINLGGAAGRVLNQILSDLMAVYIRQQLIMPLLGRVGSGSLSGGGAPSFAGTGSIASYTTNFSGLLPGRATGGPVAAGRAYVVGEHGKEVFLPSESGTIIPNHKAFGSTPNLMPQGRAFGATPNIGPASGSGGGIAKVQLHLSGDIDARIMSVAGPVAVEVVNAKTPEIVRTSAVTTIKTLKTPRL